MRHFFGLSIQAPWPENLPEGRVTEPERRHLTLAFLGNTQEDLSDAPKPEFALGPAGFFDACLCRRNVVAWRVEWVTGADPIEAYQEQLVTWLQGRGFPRDSRPWLPHATLARRPFETIPWEENFSPLPLLVDGVHLYADYEPIWSFSFVPPFEEREHTADIAFCIRGETIAQVHSHAELALSWHFPPLLGYREPQRIAQFDDLVAALNDLVSRSDAAQGAPYKAVSYAGALAERADGLLEWEMIVDV